MKDSESGYDTFVFKTGKSMFNTDFGMGFVMRSLFLDHGLLSI